GLVFQVADPQAAHGLHYQVIELVGVGAAAVPRDALATIHGAAFGVLLDERLVARLLYEACDLVDRLVPRDIFPMVRSGPPHFGLEQSSLVDDVLLQGRALWTESAAIDRVVGISFDVHHLRRDILRFVAECVDDDAATHRAIRARGARLGGTGNLQIAGFRV